MFKKLTQITVLLLVILIFSVAVIFLLDLWNVIEGPTAVDAYFKTGYTFLVIWGVSVLVVLLSQITKK